jgi:hypothetical protein
MGKFIKRKSPRLVGFDYDSAGAYFVTLCTKDMKCLLSRIELENIRAEEIVGTGVPDCPKSIRMTRRNGTSQGAIVLHSPLG